MGSAVRPDPGDQMTRERDDVTNDKSDKEGGWKGKGGDSMAWLRLSEKILGIPGKFMDLSEQILRIPMKFVDLSEQVHEIVRKHPRNS